MHPVVVASWYRFDRYSDYQATRHQSSDSCKASLVIIRPNVVDSFRRYSTSLRQVMLTEFGFLGFVLFENYIMHRTVGHFRRRLYRKPSTLGFRFLSSLSFEVHSFCWCASFRLQILLRNSNWCIAMHGIKNLTYKVEWNFFYNWKDFSTLFLLQPVSIQIVDGSSTLPDILWIDIA